MYRRSREELLIAMASANEEDRYWAFWELQVKAKYDDLSQDWKAIRHLKKLFTVNASLSDLLFPVAYNIHPKLQHNIFQQFCHSHRNTSPACWSL